MPLHSKGPAGRIDRERLDGAVLGAAYDLKALPEPVDALMVIAGRRNRTRRKPGHLTLDDDLMYDVPVMRIHVLDQCAAARDVDDVQATAYRQRRNALLQAVRRQRDVRCILQSIDVVHLRVNVSFAVEPGIDIRAAGKQDTVNAGQASRPIPSVRAVCREQRDGLRSREPEGLQQCARGHHRGVPRGRRVLGKTAQQGDTGSSHSGRVVRPVAC